MRYLLSGAVLLLVILVATSLPARAGLVTEALRIPMAEAGPDGLEAVLVRPDTPGRHPLALVSHGSPRRAEERPGMSARGLMPQLTELARRGFVAVAVLRRGYGSSSGGWADGYGPCDHPSYEAAGRRGAADLRAAIAVLSRRADVDPTKVLAMGTSAGGFATVALTADPPPGLVAAISFAGGRGSTVQGDVCHDEVLVDAFRAYGTRSRTPMLWIYSDNDHFFNPALARRLVRAFNGAGGRAEFVQVDPIGQEGHFLFSPAGRAVWLPIVDAYLQRHGFSPSAALEAPPRLDAKGREAFRGFLAGAAHKAFAVSDTGGYAWRTGRGTAKEAIDAALARCEAESRSTCRLYAVDDEYAHGR